MKLIAPNRVRLVSIPRLHGCCVMVLRLWILAGCLVGGLCNHASAGVVVTGDGTSTTGTVMLVGTGEPKVSVTPVGKSPKVVKLSDIKTALFDPRAGEIGVREVD